MKTNMMDHRLIMILFCMLALILLPAVFAAAEQGGSGIGGPRTGNDQRQMGDEKRQHGDVMKQGQGGGSKTLESDVLRGGKPTASESQKPTATGGSAILGRLNMARAYLSPGFDPSKIDDPEAPLANLDAYKTLLEDGGTVTLEQLATYLAKVATAPLTADSIIRLNEILKVALPSDISAAALADRVNVLVKENREE